MRRRLLAACVTLTIACPLVLAGAGSGVYAPDQRSAHEAAALRHQLRVERVRSERSIARMKAVLRARPDVNEAIHLGAVAYGVDEGRMRAIIWRESRFRPWAKNPRSTAGGLAQFLDTTWATTPCGRAGLSRFSPYPAALCMAWYVHEHGWGAWAL